MRGRERSSIGKGSNVVGALDCYGGIGSSAFKQRGESIFNGVSPMKVENAKALVALSSSPLNNITATNKMKNLFKRESDTTVPFIPYTGPNQGRKVFLKSINVSKNLNKAQPPVLNQNCGNVQRGGSFIKDEENSVSYLGQ
jgi:hypothetical protein